MSRNLLILLLSELKTLRFVCKNQGCGAVSEVSPAQASSMFYTSPKCVACANMFYVQEAFKGNPIVDFIKAIKDMQSPDVAKHLDIEFVVAEPVKK